MKRIGVILLALIMIASFGFAGDKEPTQKKLRIGITLMDYQWEFFQTMLAMARKTAAGLGAELIDFDGQGKQEVQAKVMEDMIALKVDAIVLNPVDSAAIAPSVLAANEAGIPVVTVDVRSASGKVLAHIASNNMDIGRLNGKAAVDYLTKKYGSPKGRVLIQSYPQITSMRERALGFKEVLAKYPKVVVEEIDPIHLDQSAAMALAENQFTRYPKGQLDVYYGAKVPTSEGIYAARDTADRKEVAVIGVDDDAPELKAIADPKANWLSTVAQYPTDMGRLGVEYAVRAAKGETWGDTTKDVSTAIKLITRENIDEYTAQVDKILAEIKPFRKK
jgi:ribose transport system substrate-binding protein